jgi:hypothetical protein
MHHIQVVKKIQRLPEPLLREVDDFIEFLLTRYSRETVPPDDEYPAMLMTRLSAAGGGLDWLNDSAEDIYSDEDGEAV